MSKKSDRRCIYCGYPANYVGLCHAHDERQRKGRIPMDAPVGRTPEERFWARVSKQDTGCWLWTGARGGTRRYGMFTGTGTKARPAHRWSYEHFVGPIPDGLVLDHLCRVTLCVNPAHLEPVTQQENVMRGRAGKRWSERTHCKWGHEFTEANTHHAFTTKGQPYRACRACGREASARARAQRKVSA